MSRRPIPIKVKSKDLSQIGELLRGGIQQVRVVVRALSLRQLADGFTAPQVAQALPLTAKAVRQIAHRDIPQCSPKHFLMEVFYRTFSGGRRPSAASTSLVIRSRVTKVR